MLGEHEKSCTLLYRNECFTGRYTTCKIHKKLHLGPKWFISMFIDDSDYYLYLSPGGEGEGGEDFSGDHLILGRKKGDQ